MLEKLFQFIFELITKLADILLSPLITGLTSLFPDLTTAFTVINNFLDMCLTYFHFLWKFLMIPQSVMLALFTYLSVKYSIYLVKIAFNFVIKIYNIFKP